MIETPVKPQKPLLEVVNLKKYFPIHKGILHRHVNDVKAVDDVSFNVYPRETLALVGESGCGKTTIGRCVARAYSLTSGQLRYNEGQDQPIDLAKLSENQ